MNCSKSISPDFNTYDEAIEWFANDLLSNNSEEDLYDCIKEGSFVIYDDKLNAQLQSTNKKLVSVMSKCFVSFSHFVGVFTFFASCT